MRTVYARTGVCFRADKIVITDILPAFKVRFNAAFMRVRWQSINGETKIVLPLGFTFYLNALGGRPASETFPYSWRFGSRGVIGRRVDINRAPATKNGINLGNIEPSFRPLLCADSCVGIDV